MIESVLHLVGERRSPIVVSCKRQSHDGFLAVNDPAPRDKACLPVSCVTRSNVVEKAEEFSVFRRKRNSSQPVLHGFRHRNLKLARECLTGRYYYRPLNLLNVIETKTRRSK